MEYSAHNINRDDEGLLKRIACFALDLDGTLYLGGRPLPGAAAFLAAVRGSGRRFVCLTNNSSRSAKSYLEKLSGMGFGVTPEELVTSGEAAIGYLRREYPGRRVYLLGNDDLRAEFSEAGVPLDEDAPEVVVAAYDTQLTYQKLCDACRHLTKGLPFVATHPDINCPAEDGFLPDLGAFLALIEASTGRRPDIIVGKPHEEILQCMLKKAGASPAKTALVGDRLYTDIAAGKSAGMLSVLVLSGETDLAALAQSDIRPDLVFRSVQDMLPWL